MGELYGETSALTAEWVDGLAGSVLRKLAKKTGLANHWVVFDGPIDTLWIESMNTVLDDNMTLCLANGERVKLRPEMRIIFECEHLAEAAPSTVSRLGVIYFAEDTVGWLPIVHSWLDTLFPAARPLRAALGTTHTRSL